MKQIDHYLKLKKKDLSFLCSYLEGFEGMCAIRTPNPKPGDETVVHIMLSPDFLSQFEEIIEGLRKEISLEEVEP